MVLYHPQFLSLHLPQRFIAPPLFLGGVHQDAASGGSCVYVCVSVEKSPESARGV